MRRMKVGMYVPQTLQEGQTDLSHMSKGQRIKRGIDNVVQMHAHHVGNKIDRVLEEICVAERDQIFVRHVREVGEMFVCALADLFDCH